MFDRATIAARQISNPSALAIRHASYFDSIANLWKAERLAIKMDDSDVNAFFLRPLQRSQASITLALGFGHLRREAITAMGSTPGLGIGQMMNFGGHSSSDMSSLYTLKDSKEQERAIMAQQDLILGGKSVLELGAKTSK